MPENRLLSRCRRRISSLLYEWLDAAPTPPRRDRYTEHDRDTFDSLIDIAEELAVEVFAPINKLLDANEPVMDENGVVVQPAELRTALRAFAETGLTASTFDERLGGGQLPYVVRAACSMFLEAGSIAAYAYPFLTGGTPTCSSPTAHGSRSTPTSR